MTSYMTAMMHRTCIRSKGKTIVVFVAYAVVDDDDIVVVDIVVVDVVCC